MIKNWLNTVVGSMIQLPSLRERSERGLSQSTENAILLAGAVAIATLVIAVITAYVKGKLPQ